MPNESGRTLGFNVSMKKLSKRGSTLLIIIATMLILFANFAFWLKTYIFDAKNFKEISVSATLEKDSRDALANEIVGNALEGRPVLEETLGPRLESLVSGLLDSSVSRAVVEKIAETVQKQLTSKETEPVTLNTATIKNLLVPLSEIVSKGESVQTEINKIPDEIVLTERDVIPNVYGWGSTVLWLGPFCFFAGIGLFIYLWLQVPERGWAIRTSGWSLLVGSLVMMLIPYLFQPAILSSISNTDASLVIENIYSAFSIKFVEQTLVLVSATGAVLVIAGYLFNRYSTKNKNVL